MHVIFLLFAICPTEHINHSSSRALPSRQRHLQVSPRMRSVTNCCTSKSVKLIPISSSSSAALSALSPVSASTSSSPSSVPQSSSALSSGSSLSWSSRTSSTASWSSGVGPRAWVAGFQHWAAIGSTTLKVTAMQRPGLQLWLSRLRLVVRVTAGWAASLAGGGWSCCLLDRFSTVRATISPSQDDPSRPHCASQTSQIEHCSVYSATAALADSRRKAAHREASLEQILLQFSNSHSTI